MDDERILNLITALGRQLDETSAQLSRSFLEANARLEERLEERLAQRLEERLEQRMDKRFQEWGAQLDKRFQESVAQLEQRFDRKLTKAIDESSASLLKLIADTSASLQREIRSLDAKMENRFSTLNDRLDRMNARVERQGGELIAGARWIARLTEWTQATDNHMDRRDARITDLETRISKLESDRPPAA